MNDSTSDIIKVDTARLPLLLRELRLPTIAAMWQSFTDRADREGWPAARLLATIPASDAASLRGRPSITMASANRRRTWAASAHEPDNALAVPRSYDPFV
jgi:hypothetical protein